MSQPRIRFIDADETWKARVAQFSRWGELAARHLHFEDGFSILALQDDDPAGYISVQIRELPGPLSGTCEGYIDILEVRQDLHRQSIARNLIEISAERARARGLHQLRSWSSLDKNEAILMWKALGFGLCPAATYHDGQEVKGYFVTRLFAREPEGQ